MAASNVVPLGKTGEKRTLNYRMAAKGQDAEVYIYDIIGDSWFGGISAKQFSDDLKALGSPKTIHVRINSDGGDVFAGRSMYTLLNQHAARVVVHVDGLAASIASLIAMAGDEIRMGDGTYMMIHNAWGVAAGDSAEMRRTADLLDSVTETIAETYCARTKCDPEKVRKMMSDETWMTAADAKELGFCDVIDETVKAAASVRDPSLFHNLPAALRPERVRVAALANRIRTALAV